MRTYPQNSPQAAARIIALTIVADGDVSKAEFSLLDELAVHEQLGLGRDALHEVFDNFCVDLLSDNHLGAPGACPVDDYTLSTLMNEIDNIDLRKRLLELCVKIAKADDHVAEGESIILVAAVEHWGLQHQMLRH